MKTTISMPYGSDFLKFEVPTSNLMGILTSRHLPGIKDEAGAIREALKNPIASAPLTSRLHKNDKVVVITTDNTRHCPDDRILPVILEELETVVARDNITIIVALGLHAPLNRKELAAKLGADIVAGYRVKNHDPNQTTYLGRTSRGNPVEVNTEVVNADFRISTGFIEPHFFAGFSGGRKSISPGVSSARAIHQNHSFMMIEHPNSRAGVLVGNPVHEDLVEHARMARLDFIVNVLLNAEKGITHVFAGDPWDAHAQGCAKEKGLVQVEIDQPADITIVSNGGAPLDLDFYQACKGIDTASQITRDGGIIIMASSCLRGAGPESFTSLHCSCGTPEKVMATLRNSSCDGVGWQNQILARAQMHHTVFLLSSLPPQTVENMLVTPIFSIEEGLEKAFQLLGSKARVAVIPEGPMVIPVIK